MMATNHSLLAQSWLEIHTSKTAKQGNLYVFVLGMIKEWTWFQL